MLRVTDITKSFRSEGVETPALHQVSLHVQPGEFLAVEGRSGSGKSTLLSIMSTLLKPDAGTVEYQGLDLAAAGERTLNRVRHSDFAVIFQFHHLMPYLTALENTLLPFMADFKPIPSRLAARGREALDRVGLGGKHNRLPRELSGGEQQRVAIARALVKDACVLFADEPTGSLDRTTGDGVMNLLQDLNRDGLTIAMVTHEPSYAALAHRTVRMADGRVLN